MTTMPEFKAAYLKKILITGITLKANQILWCDCTVLLYKSCHPDELEDCKYCSAGGGMIMYDGNDIAERIQRSSQFISLTQRTIVRSRT